MRRQESSWRSGAVVAVSAFVLLSQNAFAVTSFTDVPKSYWADQFIDYLSGRHIITGYPDSTFRPTRPVTRAEFAVMLAKSQGLPTGAGGGQASGKAGGHATVVADGLAGGAGGGQVFTDVPDSHWAARAVQSVARQGWTAGYPGGRFLPDQEISMVEMYVILAKALHQPQVGVAETNNILKEYRDADLIPNWARIPVASAIHAGVNVRELSANELYPNTQATRAGVADAIAKLVDPSFRDTGLASAQQPPAVLQKQGSITLTGTLRPSKLTPGAWLLETADNRVYRILNPDSFNNTNMFRLGNNVTVIGNLRPDVTLPQTEGAALVADRLSTAQTTSPAAISGALQPTTETAGWTVTSIKPASEIVMSDIKPASGTVVTSTKPVSGSVVASVKPASESVVASTKPTSGSVVASVKPAPGSVVANTKPASGSVVASIAPASVSGGVVTSTQQVGLFFPNLVNIEQDPDTMLGAPIVRNIQGSRLPQQAIQALLKGPSDIERMQGFFVDDDIKKLTLDQFNLDANGSATVVLDAPANFRFQSAVTPQRLDAQISRTLQQLTGVKQVDVAVKDANNSLIWSSR